MLTKANVNQGNNTKCYAIYNRQSNHSFARVQVKDKKILILDEVVASIYYETDREYGRYVHNRVPWPLYCPYVPRSPSFPLTNGLPDASCRVSTKCRSRHRKFVASDGLNITRFDAPDGLRAQNRIFGQCASILAMLEDIRVRT